ncbi:hypothetical protein G6L08_23425 [Agrobacterium rhizogenes]|nr:hypothetical protein [Rhizobium rhizogenes]
MKGTRMMQIVRVPLLALVVAAFAALPGCAGHKELKAPCSAAISSVFSSRAYAGGVNDRCGPMVRQLSVIVNDDRGVTIL